VQMSAEAWTLAVKAGCGPPAWTSIRQSWLQLGERTEIMGTSNAQSIPDMALR
jgi:hypothetical protein